MLYHPYFIRHATKYSVIRTETCEVILPGWQCWSKQRIFLHGLVTFTNNAVKHKSHNLLIS